MWPRVLGPNYDVRRLRAVLAVLFAALAIPTGVVLWQAHGQLKWESFHLYRGQAEELTARIDAELADAIAEAEARSFTEYTFLNVGDPGGVGYLQRSPLSEFPVESGLPGVIGYFQVDARGNFSTPLLPDQPGGAEALGIDEEELRGRRALAERLRGILVGNRLVDSREAPGTDSQAMFDQLKQNIAEPPGRQAARELEAEEDYDALASEPQAVARVSDLKLDDALQRKAERAEVEETTGRKLEAAPPQPASAADRARRKEQSALLESVDVTGARAPAEARANEGEAEGVDERADERASQAADRFASADASLSLRDGIDAVGDERDEPLRITTFESEVDPFEFSLLGSGELVLFRKVWREGERLVQGILIDRDRFFDGAVLKPFRAAGLAQMSNLVLAVGDSVLEVAEAHEGAGASMDERDAPNYGGADMAGELLYRSRLSSPLDAVEMIYTLNRLPAGPGASVLWWTSAILAAVFGLGFIALYRLGLGQIRLSRQQQDFVSSVSHELRTPLTSIRMYSEMLKEGWADEEKRAQYYAFIHDESERLSRLIANVLQLASITRNTPSIEMVPVRVSDLLDKVRSKVASQVERAGFELEIGCDGDVGAAQIEVDEDCMMQIVINLVDNAIKFSAEADRKRLEIGARMTGDGRLRLSVRDYGPGIPRDQMKKIFRLFYRPRSELTRETVGTGIGLAIVHQLAGMMKAEVDVRNCEPGAEFGVSFELLPG